MRNGPTLPLVAIVMAAVLGIVVVATHGASGEPLTELELGGVAWAVGLAVYGVQGFVSIVLEGRELRPGRAPPRLTDLLSAGIVLFALVLLGIAIALGAGIALEWGVGTIGALAGAGCLALALLLVFYKEAFVGDEAALDERDDGIPW